MLVFAGTRVVTLFMPLALVVSLSPHQLLFCYCFLLSCTAVVLDGLAEVWMGMTSWNDLMDGSVVYLQQQGVY